MRNDVLAQGRVAREHHATPVPIHPITECRIAVGVLDRERRQLDAVALEHHAVADDVRLDREGLDRIELVDPCLEIVAEHGPHSLHHLRGSLRAPQFEAVVATQQKPWRHPQIGQSFEMIVVKMGEEYL